MSAIKKFFRRNFRPMIIWFMVFLFIGSIVTGGIAAFMPSQY